MYHFDFYISSNICTNGFFREEVEGYLSNKHEIISIFKYFNSITKFVEGFSKAKRFGDIKRCCRLSLKSDNPWNYPNRRDCFNFPVDKDVALHAIIFSSLKTKIKLTSDLRGERQYKQISSSNRNCIVSTRVVAVREMQLPWFRGLFRPAN